MNKIERNGEINWLKLIKMPICNEEMQKPGAYRRNDVKSRKKTSSSEKSQQVQREEKNAQNPFINSVF